MFPIEHCEKFISPESATGLIKNFSLASQVLVLSGQQGLVLLHPAVHCEHKMSTTLSRGWIRFDTYIMLRDRSGSVGIRAVVRESIGIKTEWTYDGPKVMTHLVRDYLPFRQTCR